MARSGDREPQDNPALLDWRWGDDREGDGVRVAGDGTVRLQAADGRLVIRAADAAGRTAWTEPVDDADAGSIDADDHTAYVALYRSGATGARLRALEVTTGRARWEVSLAGLGPVHHSKYANRVRVRLVATRVIVYGNEAGGRYVEVRAASDGRLVAHRVMPPTEPRPRDAGPVDVTGT
jgi:outer membrane protein assembly factor BamB